MLLCDVNVLVYAHREDIANHLPYREWLESVINGDQAYAVSDLILSGFVRVVTHPKIFGKPSTLCSTAAAKGNLVPDAYLAALAIEAGCEWITTDRDFSRFPGLRWRSPLD